jgi:ATP/maltotriose-dependent transcriptional regulator MalT
MSKTGRASIAKLTRPDVSGLVARPRPMGLLDAGSGRPVTWVSGPAGSGKTSLVSSYLAARGLPCLWYQVDEGDADVATIFYYLGLAARSAGRVRKPLPLLTPEYLPGLGTFTRRYFEALCGTLARPFAIVFDNYQEVPLASRFHEVMRDALYALPEGVRVVVMSRAAPPATLARLQASSSVTHVGWEDLRFTFEEVKGLVAALSRRVLPDAVLKALYERTEGWAAGIVLLLARLRTQEPSPATLAKSTPEEVFQFFAGELFDKADEETRSFLLRSSPLTSMTAAAAAELTGNLSSGRILSALSRSHFFTELLPSAEPVYQYHPLFRDFLRFRAEEALPGESLAALRRDAAALLERAGRGEEAADLLVATGDWARLALLVHASAPGLIAQGRTHTLDGWLRSFPAAELERSPWLEHWTAACKLSFEPVESRRHFERAFGLFETAGDLEGLFLSWAGAMEAVLLGWGDFSDADRWVERLEELLREGTEPPTPRIAARVTTSMLFALTLRQPHHPAIRSWVERARRIASDGADPRLQAFVNVYLELYYLWVGDHAGAEIVLKGVRESTASPDASPLARILGRIIEAVYRVRMAEHAQCRRAVEEGLEIATSSGVVIWNSQLFSQGALNALGEGDLGEAARYLGQMGASYRPARRIDACMFHYSTAWHAFLGGDLARALEHAASALRFALEAGTPFHEAISRHALAQVLHERGERPAAAEHLARVKEIARAMGSRILEFMASLCEAHFALDEHEGGAAPDDLARALAIGREQGYVNFYWWRPDVMARLCGRALRAGVEVAYAQRLIRLRRLVPAAPSSAGELWPWPLRIRTLGGFELYRDGAPVASSGKVQRKPLALLKALVSLGGREVPEERLTDALWPDADGDLARRSLETCLYRLRKLVGRDDFVRVRERRVTLDPRWCAVDVWALEHAFSEADHAWKLAHRCVPRAAEPPEQRALRLSEEAISLYQGHFLPMEAGPAALACRERLRRKFLRVVLEAGEGLARAKEWPRAARAIQRAIEVEGSPDPPLPSAPGALDPSNAEATYHRCRALLLSLHAADA